MVLEVGFQGAIGPLAGGLEGSALQSLDRRVAPTQSSCAGCGAAAPRPWGAIAPQTPSLRILCAPCGAFRTLGALPPNPHFLF